jgi:AcrR family transcriptional regulator
MTGAVKDAQKPSRGRPDEGARDALIEAATRLFIERDFDQVSTEQILERAGVSRGAMYHHFSGKVELFEAVYRSTELRAVTRIATSAAKADGPYAALVAGSHAYLREAETSAEMRRIGLRQSRAVLGWERWREVASGLGLGLVAASLQAAVEAGEIRAVDVPVASLLLLGAMIEGAMLVAVADDPAAERAKVADVVDGLLESLRP